MTTAATDLDRSRTTHPQRWSFGLLLVLLALALGVSALPSPLYPIYQSEWGLSPLSITAVFAVYAVGALTSALTVGPISDAIGRKPLLILALVSILAGLVVFLVADTTWHLMVARLLHGGAIGAITVVSGAALLDVRPFDGSRNGMLSGVALNLGITVTVTASAAAAQWGPSPLRTPYVVIGVVILVLLAAVIVLVEPHAERTGGRIRLQRPSVPAAIRADFWFSGMGILTTWSTLGVFLSLYPALTQKATGHTSIFFVGIVVSVMAGASAITQRAGVLLTPRNAAIVGDVGMVISLLGAIWALNSGSTAAIMIDTVVLGGAFGLAFGGSLRHLGEVAPANARGRVMSAYYLLGYLAIGIPTVVAGALSSQFGTEKIFPWFVSAVALACLVAAILGYRGGRRPVVETPVGL
ncbi:MFS transporter [Gordonia zhaorongruii]|uniref:MFS transporter n=1 Tax=Gordonia zhaorongruii TaxID=2597659 RepID=UPI00104C7321|nr:MFS transporter [Gordonia zhaorongruii]